jgi:hypothetical protein
MIKPIPTDSFQTFIAWNYIRLSTNLEDPRWNVIVHENKVVVPVVPISENVVEIEGVLLSHPIGTNVTVNIQLEGRVPGSATGQLTLLQAEEVDQKTVIGPVQVISVSIAPDTTAGVSPSPTETVPTTTPTKAALPPITALAGVLVALGVFGRKKS